MPIFVFRCESCNKLVEKLFLHKVSTNIEDSVKEFIAARCECGGQLIGAAGVPNLKFVGKDFYVTEERARREKKRVANDIRTARENIAKSERKDREAKTSKD